MRAWPSAWPGVRVGGAPTEGLPAVNVGSIVDLPGSRSTSLRWQSCTGRSQRRRRGRSAGSGECSGGRQHLQATIGSATADGKVVATDNSRRYEASASACRARAGTRVSLSRPRSGQLQALENERRCIACARVRARGDRRSRHARHLRQLRRYRLCMCTLVSWIAPRVSTGLLAQGSVHAGPTAACHGQTSPRVDRVRGHDQLGRDVDIDRCVVGRPCAHPSLKESLKECSKRLHCCGD